MIENARCWDSLHHIKIGRHGAQQGNEKVGRGESDKCAKEV